MTSSRRCDAKAGLLALVTATGIFTGCANNQVVGYQNVYQGYQIPQPLIDRASQKLREFGLVNARLGRDNVGRLRLLGSYRNEDEVERAFIIVQSIVGIKSTSPFYPEDVKERRWEQDAARAMVEFSRGQKAAITNAPGKRRALVIGINHFIDSKHLADILGEDDARVVGRALERAHYEVTALYGPQATKQNIESAIAEMGKSIGPNDTLFLYVSSHGAPPVPTPSGNDERRMSVIAYDSAQTPGTRVPRDITDFSLLVQETSVRDTLLQDVARKPTKVTRVFIDTCYSGEMLRGAPEDSRAYILRTNGGKEEREGISVTAWTGSTQSKGIRVVTDANTSAESARRTDPATLTRAGYELITATSQDEESFGPREGHFTSPLKQGRELHGSFFTQTFFEYLATNGGDVPDAFDRASRFTQSAVATALPGSHQVPRKFSNLPATDDNLFR